MKYNNSSIFGIHRCSAGILNLTCLSQCSLSPHPENWFSVWILYLRLFLLPHQSLDCISGMSLPSFLNGTLYSAFLFLQCTAGNYLISTLKAYCHSLTQNLYWCLTAYKIISRPQPVHQKSYLNSPFPFLISFPRLSTSQSSSTCPYCSVCAYVLHLLAASHFCLFLSSTQPTPLSQHWTH